MERAQFLDGNKLKISLISLFLLVITQACFQKKEGNSFSQKKSNDTTVIQDTDSLIINTIEDFYVSYISENSKDKVNRNTINEIKNKYVTKNLLLNIEEQMSSGSLDWDPFVNAQDFYDGWIKTLKIEKDKSNINLYVVSYYNGVEDEKIYLDVIKENNQYKISAILGINLSLENKNETDFSNYLKNENYIIYTLDINGDKVDDKIISSKPRVGNELIIFLGNKDKYKQSIKTINFSQDGGNIIKDITPSKNNVGFILTTYFPDRGYYEEDYIIDLVDDNWVLNSTIYKTTSDMSENAVTYHCKVIQKINLNDPQILDKIKLIPEESERDRKCKKIK